MKCLKLLVNVYLTTRQRHRRCASVSMNTSAMSNIIMMQRRRFYVGIPMNVLGNIKILMVQLGTSCAFESPWLARNEPTPGKHPQGDSTP